MYKEGYDNYYPKKVKRNKSPSLVCDFCDGTRYTDCYIEQHGWVQYKCPKCNGTGKSNEE